MTEDDRLRASLLVQVRGDVQGSGVEGGRVVCSNPNSRPEILKAWQGTLRWTQDCSTDVDAWL